MALGGNEAYIHSISNFTIGSGAISYKVDKYTSSTDNLTVKIGSTVIATRNNVTGDDWGTVTRTITFSSAELTKIYNAMPTVTKATFTFTIASYIGSDLLGSSNATATGTLADSIKPSISSVALSEYVTGIASQFGGYVQKQSQIRGIITATAGAGSSIASYKTVINGQTLTSAAFTTSTLKTAGTNTATVTVTDRRGRTATSTATFNVIAYEYPTISTYSVVRCLADGTEDVSGESVKININSSIVSVNNKNTKNFKLEYKKKGDTAWTTLLTYADGYTYTLTNSIRSGYSSDFAYDFKLTVKDYFHEAVVTKTISTGFALIDLKGNGKGMAVGKVSSEDDTFDIGFKKTFLPNETFMSGERRDDTEKNLHFQSTGNGQYNHNCKVYGGNGNSATSIGMWDMELGELIYRYMSSTQTLEFGAKNDLIQNGRPIMVDKGYAHGHNTGSLQFSNGLVIQHGVAVITPTAANVSTGLEIMLPIPCDVRPTAIVIPQTSTPDILDVAIGQGSVNYNRFTIFVTRTNTAATTVHWFAIGYKGV